MDQLQMKGIHLLFMHSPDILAIDNTTPKLTQFSGQSSGWNFVHGGIRLTWAKLDKTLFQWRHNNLWSVQKKCLEILENERL
jgi:hypothetical protein